VVDDRATCAYCGQPIRLANEEHATKFGECWHTDDLSDNPICPYPQESSDGDLSYEHRPATKDERTAQQWA